MASPGSNEMHLFSARLESFHIAHQFKKRRKSSTTSKKKKDSQTEWPHKKPSPEQLARAGFYYRPGEDSNDNVQCFFCDVKLDGWEPLDDPIQEHLAHSDWCAWATARSVDREEDRADLSPEERDPMSESLLTARQATFTHGDGWPHEGKKGWKCKVTKMVQAGWAWDPTADGDEADGVTCFYCNISLDGWEPEDDPLEEHRRRAPDCVFFKLLDNYHGSAEPSTKPRKTKGKRKGGTSSGAASRASIQSTMSDMPTTIESLSDMPADSSIAIIDDSIVTTATLSHPTVAKVEQGKKKGSKSKGTSKGTASKKIASRIEAEEHLMVDYPDLGDQEQYQSVDPVDLQQIVSEEESGKPSTKSRKKLLRSQNETSTMEVDPVQAATSKRPARGRKPKAKETSILEDTDLNDTQSVGMEHAADVRESTAYEQLQSELERSVDNFDEVPPADQSTPPVIRTKKRGTKRTSDGVPKHSTPPVIAELEDSIALQEKQAGKTKKIRKAKAELQVTSEARFAVEQQSADRIAETEDQDRNQKISAGQDSSSQAKPALKKTKTRTKAKKVSSASSSGLSETAAAIATGSAIFLDEPQDLARDEMEIEAELARIEQEQASLGVPDENQIPREAVTSTSESKANRKQKQQEVSVAQQRHGYSSASPVRRLQQDLEERYTPSPGASDKENQPSSIIRPSTKRTQPHVILSPTKTTKIPVAPGTPPNRSPLRARASPTKQFSRLSSTVPWAAIELDTVLLQSPQPTPGRLGQAFLAVAGELTSPEKSMSVEEWVNYRAMKGEEEMKQRCERNVAAFEREGIRGLQSLAGIEVIG